MSYFMQKYRVKMNSSVTTLCIQLYQIIHQICNGFNLFVIKHTHLFNQRFKLHRICRIEIKKLAWCYFEELKNSQIYNRSLRISRLTMLFRKWRVCPKVEQSQGVQDMLFYVVRIKQKNLLQLLKQRITICPTR